MPTYRGPKLVTFDNRAGVRKVVKVLAKRMKGAKHLTIVLEHEGSMYVESSRQTDSDIR